MGNTMAERFDKWHHLNPGQMVKGQLSANANPTGEQLMFVVEQQALQKAEEQADIEVKLQRVLTDEDRISCLKQELFQLETRRNSRQQFDAVEITTRPPKGRPTILAKDLTKPQDKSPNHRTTIEEVKDKDAHVITPVSKGKQVTFQEPEDA